MAKVTRTGSGPWVPRASESKSGLKPRAEAGPRPQARAHRALCGPPCSPPRGTVGRVPEAPGGVGGRHVRRPRLGFPGSCSQNRALFGESVDLAVSLGPWFWVLCGGVLRAFRKSDGECQHSDLQNHVWARTPGSLISRALSGEAGGRSLACPESGQPWMTVGGCFPKP